MIAGEITMRSFAWLAFGLWAWAEDRALAGAGRFARIPWASGAAFLVIHMVLAFQQVHHWSHITAVEETARQTEAVVGVHWGGGIWFNYATATLWLTDVIRLWTRPSDKFGTRRRQPLRWFFAVMWLNGAVIFTHSPLRWPAAIVFVLLGWRLLRVRGSSRVRERQSADGTG